MNCSTYKPQLSGTFEDVRNLSFAEKKEAAHDEQRMNSFLDGILAFKQYLTAKTAKVESIIEKLEQITWFTDPDQEPLLLTNDVVSATRSLHASLQRQCASFSLFRTKGNAKEELKSFKAVVDDLTEIANDLDSRFFFLPNNEAFTETTKALSLI